MKSPIGNQIFLLMCSLLISGHENEASSYSYHATTKCQLEPETPPYNGGIIVNSEFNEGSKGWEVFGQGLMEVRTFNGTNKFMVAHNRSQPSDSFSQKLHLEENMLYTFSAWVQVSKGTDTIAVNFRTPHGFLIQGGAITSNSGCWSMLKGGILPNVSGPTEFYFKSQNPEVEIWVDNVSLHSFTKEQWTSHQTENIEKVRKKKVRLLATDFDGNKLAAARVSIKQTTIAFPFGCAMTKNILTSIAYQNWFAKRFTVTTFSNEMKWYSTEMQQDQVNYTDPDAMLAFAKENGIAVRGHNILWDGQQYQPEWVKQLECDELRNAAAKRIHSIVNRYERQLIAWDVVNENLHFSFFEDKLGENASAIFFSKAHELDPETTLFMNEFNTIEYSGDLLASPNNYLKKLQQILDFPGNQGLPVGIGLQSHFLSGRPNLPYMRATLDVLGSTGLPIWLTEVDIAKDENQAQYLEEILREGYSHPAVQGIVIWSGPEIDGCDRMCLTDSNYQNTPVGDVVDKLIHEWRYHSFDTTTDNKGYIERSLFYGDYRVSITHPEKNSSSSTQSFKVAKGDSMEEETIHIQIKV